MAQCNGNLIVFACEEPLMRSILQTMGANLMKAERRRSRRYISAATTIKLEPTDTTEELLNQITPLYLKDAVAAFQPRSDTTAEGMRILAPQLEREQDYCVLSLAFETDGGIADSDLVAFVQSLPMESCGIAACHWFEGLDKYLLTQGNLRDGGPFCCGQPAAAVDPFELFCGQDGFATDEQWDRFLEVYGSEAPEDATIGADAPTTATLPESQQRAAQTSTNPQTVANRKLATMIGDQLLGGIAEDLLYLDVFAGIERRCLALA